MLEDFNCNQTIIINKCNCFRALESILLQFLKATRATVIVSQRLKLEKRVTERCGPWFSYCFLV